MSKFLPTGWRYGKKRPHTAFIGGFGTTPQGYQAGIEKIGELHPLYNFDVMNYSCNGYDKKMSLNNYADLLTNILDEYPHIDTLIGHSLGGAICLQTILDNSDRIKKAVLINSLGVKINKLNKIVWRNIKEPNKDILSNINKDTVQSFIQAYVNNPIYYMRTVDLCFKVDLTKQLSKIDIPIKIIWSKEDELLPLSLGKELHSHLSSSELIEIDGLHNPFQIKNDTFIETWEHEVTSFIA